MAQITVQEFVTEVREKHLDQFELPFPSSPSLNGVMYMGTYLTIIRKVYGARLAELDRLAIGKVLMACFQERDHVGLLFRNPVNRDQEGPDDYLGFAAASLALESKALPQAVVDYWDAHGGWMNNEIPGTKRDRTGHGKNWHAAMWRFPHLYGFLLYASGGRMSWWRRLWNLAGCFWPLGEYGETSSKHMDWLRFQWLKDESKLCAWGVRMWEKRMAKLYPSGIQEVFRIYFGPEHPFTKAVSDPLPKAPEVGLE